MLLSATNVYLTGGERNVTWIRVSLITCKGMMGTEKKVGPVAPEIFGWGENAYSWRDELKVFIL